MRGSVADSLRRAAYAAAAVLLLAGGMPSAARAAEPRAVRDPHYGEVLYYFYQQKYFSALGHLMTAQHFGRIGHHADEAELLRGGLLLSYGVHLEAGRIFEQLIAAGARPEVRDRAWFYLAKIRYQRGYMSEAEEALARIGGQLPGDLEAERQVLHAFLLMNRGQFQEAAARLESLKGGPDWARYGRYNLGVALVRAGEVERGIALLDKLGKEPVDTEELASLRDKANVALGYTLLRAGREGYARTCLERVRLTSVMANKALLAMGWAHIAQGNADRALVHWNELQQRPIQDAAAQESLLAVPYAFGQLGAWRQALQHYEQANAAYEREIGEIDRSITAIRAGKLGELLLRDQPLEDMGWFWQLEQPPEAPETRYLVPLMASHDFQEALKNYRDLRFLSAQLDRWIADAGIYQDMLAARRARFRERLPAVMNSPRARQATGFAASRDRLAGELARLEQEPDPAALATDQQRDQLARLERIQRGLASGKPGTADPETADRVRLLRGLLAWDMSADYPARVWETRKSLRELDAAIAETDQRRATLDQARVAVPKEFDAFESRIQAFAPRMRALQARAAELARAQGDYLSGLAVAELQAQRARLATYITQVRFAVAQIYDKSATTPAEAP